jgi:hypothetical protein
VHRAADDADVRARLQRVAEAARHVHVIGRPGRRAELGRRVRTAGVV